MTNPMDDLRQASADVSGVAVLSPAAHDILGAFDERYELLGPLESNWPEVCLAAALRAAALHCKRDNLILLALADELESQ
jgi:hypothetical protein